LLSYAAIKISELWQGVSRRRHLPNTSVTGDGEPDLALALLLRYGRLAFLSAVELFSEEGQGVLHPRS